MIVRSFEQTLWMVTQTDHAHWAYQLLSAWPSLADHPRRGALLEATRLHDRGWQGIDSSPVVDDDGRPHDFRSLPAELREQVWRRGLEIPEDPNADPQQLYPQEAVHADPAVGWRELLIAHHAWIIHRPEKRLLRRSENSGDEGSELSLATALAAERERRLEAFLEAWGHLDSWPAERLEDVLEQDYLWLRTLDFLSLIACNGWEDPYDIPEPRCGTIDGDEEPTSTLWASFQGTTLRLEPFPLRGSTAIPLKAREIPDRRYSSDSDLALELARAPWQTIRLRVAPRA